MVSMNPLDFVFRGGTKGSLTILIFHRVVAEPDALAPNELCRSEFLWQMQFLAKSFNVVPLRQGVSDLYQGTLAPRSVAITFDDGYEDNHSVALPILESLGLHATFFVATGFLDGRLMWNDTILESIRGTSKRSVDLEFCDMGCISLAKVDQRIAAITALQNKFKYMPMDARKEKLQYLAQALDAKDMPVLMMNRQQVADLKVRGMAIGGHTRNHPILSVEERLIAEAEISAGIADLEDITQSKVDLFAYPNGKPGTDFDDSHLEILRTSGVKYAVTTAPGVAREGSNPLHLPRFTPWDKSAARYLARLAINTRSDA